MEKHFHIYYESNQQDATVQFNLLFLVSATCFGRKHRPKHVELTRNNKLTYIVASCWFFVVV